MTRAIILGSNGQLGTDLLAYSPTDWQVLTHTRDEWDVTADGGLEYLLEVAPKVIINTTAFHNVDGCEKDPQIAEDVNSNAVGKLAEIANEIGATLVHISTDYVFSGESDIPYLESSPASPLNVYGKTKFHGEEKVRDIAESYYIIRISSVFGKAGASGKGGNFVYTMLNLGKTKDELNVIDDIIMSPTYTVDASKSIWEIITSEKESGTYHCNNSGQCSWYEFTKEIMSIANIDTPVNPVSHTEYPSLAEKPHFSAMSSDKGTNGRFWKDALAEFIHSL
tara:strand:+ start:811 stop:1650 length:840 start_codon:yes stop_codon:yes gene_type:complete